MADFLELDIHVDDDQATAALARIDKAQDAVVQGAKELESALKASDSALGKTYSKTNAEIDKLAENIAKKFDDLERGWKKTTSAGDQAIQTDIRAFAQLKRHTDLYDSPGGFTAGLGRANAGLRAVTSAFGVSTLATAGFAGGLALVTSQAVTAAGRIKDLSSRTDLSTDAVQRFGFVAEQTGASVENMASSAFRLGVTLSRGGSSVTGALDQLGLSLNAIRNLNPETQFDAIARALSKITNTQDRNRLGVQLFGRSYEQIAPAIREYGDLIDEATVAAQVNIDALDRWGDKIKGLGATLKATWIDVIGTIVRGLETIPDAAAKAAEDTANALGHARGGPLNSLFRLGMAPQMAESVPKRIQEDFAKTLDETTRTLTEKLTPATERQIRAYLALNHTIDETAKEFNLTNQEEQILSSVLDDMKRRTDDATRAFEQNRKTAAEWLRQFDIDLRLARIRQEELTKATERYTVVAEVAGNTSGDFWELVNRRSAMATGSFGFLPGVRQFLPGVESQTMSDWINSIRVVNAATTDWRDTLNQTANQFQRLAQIGGDSFSGLLRGIGGVTAAISATDAAIKQLQTSTTTLGRISGGLGLLTLPMTIGSFFHDDPIIAQVRALEAEARKLDLTFTRLRDHFNQGGKSAWERQADDLTRMIDRVHAAELATKSLTDVIFNATFDADQAGRTGIDAVLAQLDHQRQLELRAIEQYSAGNAALYAQAVEAVTRKYTALADRAIRDEADRMAQQTASAVDELTRVSTLLDTIKRHTDAEIASLGQFSSAGQFYDAVIAKIRGRQVAGELSSLRRASTAVGGPQLVTLGGVSIGQIVLQAEQDDPLLAARIGQAVLDDMARKGQRVS